MSAEVIELHDRRKPEDRSACETRLFLASMGVIFKEAIADTSPSEMIPYHAAGIDGVPFGGKFD